MIEVHTFTTNRECIQILMIITVKHSYENSYSILFKDLQYLIIINITNYNFM